MLKLLATAFIMLTLVQANSQTYKLFGKITNTKLEPLPFATLLLKDNAINATAKQDGTYQLQLENGKYDCVVSLVGYQKQSFTITINNIDVEQNIILELNKNNDKETVTVFGIKKDRAEEYIRNVIKNKSINETKIESFSSNVYIKAIENSNGKIATKKKVKKTITLKDSLKLTDTLNNDLLGMSMAEIQLQLDFALPNKIKETRNAVTKLGNPYNLFYLTTVDGDFSLYNNLMKVRALSETPFLSPISYSGLIAYKYKTIRVRKENKRNIYTIEFKPTKLANALLTGTVDVVDSSWIIENANFNLPKYHLVEYENFNVQQQYTLVNDTVWLLANQQFIYQVKEGKLAKNGQTNVYYNKYIINPKFPKKYFGNEVSVTIDSAYTKKEEFWKAIRTEPLSPTEVRFVRYKDSVKRATTTVHYLDSIDAITNKITFKKLVLDGVTFYNRKKERTIYIGSLTSLVNFLEPGGTRIGYNFGYNKTFKNKKYIGIYSGTDYGIRNKDVNGNLSFTKLYNPFSRGIYSIDFGRSFDQLFEGDVLINSFQKRNLYRKYHFTFGHNIEIANGLFLNNVIEIAYRESLAGLKFADLSNTIRDTAGYNPTFGRTNVPQFFEPHTALYNSVSISYTPFQQYMREPLQKVILGSKWPTFSVKWRKGIPKVLNSIVDYDYVEFRVAQRVQLGTVGISEYSFVTGNFLNKKNIQFADRKFIRGRDPYFFLYPQFNFQHIDSTFEVKNQFYEMHYVHEFNGAILSKIPLLSKLRLNEVVGGGFLYAPERNLKYVEAFAGIESKAFRILAEKFKVGIFVVGSLANQFKNPLQLKFSFRHYNKVRNRWD